MDDQQRVVTDNQVVSVHTGATGVQLFQFAPEAYTGITWGRTQSDASQCSLQVPPADVNRLDIIEPWRDWSSVYDDDTGQLLWTGPITAVSDNPRAGLSLSAKDHMCLLRATRVPTSKRWDAVDPAYIAGELWRYMADLHQLGRAKPVVLPDPDGKRYDFQTHTDDATLDTVFGDLAGMGLKYTVVSGTPVLGPLTKEPVATLSEDDFEGDGITFVKDGTSTVNDVLVRGQTNLAKARTDYHGLNLQGIVNRDSMKGLSNIQQAAEAYVQETGAVRTRLVLQPNTVLKPTAPVSIAELMPSSRFVIEARGIRQLFELTAVDVERSPSGTAVRVTMVSVNPKLELVDDKTGPNLTQGAAGSR